MNFFTDDAVQLDLLRERAFNLRWAQQPRDVIPLTAADPDFPTAPAIREYLARYVREGVLRSCWVKEDIRADLGIWSRLRTDP